MLAAKLSFRWPQCARTDLKKIIHSSNSDGIDLMAATLSWDPKRRPNTAQVGLVSAVILHLVSRLLVLETSLFQSQPRFNELIEFQRFHRR